MGVGFQWRPVYRPDDRNYVRHPLKAMMARRFWDADGSVSEGPIIVKMFTGDAAFIEGLSAAGVEGADKLYADLVEHEELEIFIDE